MTARKDEQFIKIMELEMNIKPIQYFSDERPQLFKRRIYYAQGCYIERNIRKFKDREYTLSSNYIGDKLLSTLIYVKKAGEWVKSKLKMFDNGKCYKSLRSYNNKSNRLSISELCNLVVYNKEGK